MYKSLRSGALWVVKVENLFNPLSSRNFAIFLKGTKVARLRWSNGARASGSPAESGGKIT